jgi:hypothetical protein
MENENAINKNWKLEIIGKIIFTILLIYLSLPYFFNNNPWTLFDSADLLIHEGGHLIFGFAGQFISIMGGSLTQILIPIAFGIYFAFKKSWYSLFFCIFWLGINLIYVAVYISDAKLMNLPLLAEGSIHDWNYLLTNTGLINSAKSIGSFVRILGQISIVIGFTGMILNIATSLLNMRKSTKPKLNL